MDKHEKMKVLFLCEHNSTRSQIAEAFLKQIGGEQFEVESTGLEVKPLFIIFYGPINHSGQEDILYSCPE